MIFHDLFSGGGSLSVEYDNVKKPSGICQSLIIIIE